jgi:hypothetical protein
VAGVHPLVDSSLVIEALRDGALPEGLSLAHSPSPIGLCDRGYAGSGKGQLTGIGTREKREAKKSELTSTSVGKDHTS